MSVLYKALQKAEKENEARQSASSEAFDTQRSASAGGPKYSGRPASKLHRIGMSAIIAVAVLGGGAFILFKDSLLSPAQQASMPTVAINPPPASAPLVAVPGAETATTGAAQAPPALPESAVAGTTTVPSSEPAPAAAPEASVDAGAAEPGVRPAERAVTSLPSPAVERTPPPQRPGALPAIEPNSPARMLSPPITVTRAQFALSGIGSQVQVREVSSTARQNVTAGYDALVRGSYDVALTLYDKALAEEPGSVMALLGRGSALQKLGRAQDAQIAYGEVLKLDEKNREALTNLIVLVADRSPQEALTRLLELEKEHPTFSPIKAEIGLTHAKMGSMPAALDYLRRAVALSPDSIMYHYNMALVLDHMGRREQAIASYEQVLANLTGGREAAGLSATDIERRMRFIQTR